MISKNGEKKMRQSDVEAFVLHLMSFPKNCEAPKDIMTGCARGFQCVGCGYDSLHRTKTEEDS